MNHKLIALALSGVLAIAEKNTPECPECGRLKARSAEDAANGRCPKWWAVRDPEAAADCEKFRTDPAYRETCAKYQSERSK